MPSIKVTVVDHTNSPRITPLIQKHLEDIFKELLTTPSEAGAVTIRTITTTPKDDEQDLVLHFVENIANSYVAANMPGPPIQTIDGGVTRPRQDKTGSEFYKFPTDKDGNSLGQFTATGYAKLAAHEAMHNVSGLNNDKLHPQGGIGGSPPHLPVNDANRKAFQGGLGKIPKQLL
ncbi:MAG TPA: hypothetical protein VKV39_12185 [Candidatus Sulfotelmatobacter sp.]|nr:hypothetical protein [Candidatus Sulfotelmatobacter sp.]